MPCADRRADCLQTILIHTYTQGSFEGKDDADDGSAYTSVKSLGVRMYSRQCTLVHGAGHSKKDTPFSVDSDDLCAHINEQAYDWALSKADSATKARFQKHGQKFSFGPDKENSVDLNWVLSEVNYDETILDSGEGVIQVSSNILKTAINAVHLPGLPETRCFHHCKLLSPARAMEWIYVDSLRASYST